MDYVNNPKIIRAWCLYDWANSVYSLVVTSSLFPVFFGLVAINLKGEDKIFFFGFEVVNTALFSFCVSFSFLIAGISSPFLTAFADLGDYRKKFLRFFCGLGAISCMGLALFSGKALEIGMLIFILATIGYSSSIVFYNSYLPNIASKDQLDSVSARGFAMGYLGSFLLLVTIL
ncbi:MAG TPA: MFS transporter, partial [Catalimonadaceae bacterium]|nr:MFS transporter [Catalimonadaceae bacterium]